MTIETATAERIHQEPAQPVDDYDWALHRRILPWFYLLMAISYGAILCWLVIHLPAFWELF